jgi:hypothetical protein
VTPTDGAIVVENEFARVRVEACRVGNGQRLRVVDLKTGMSFTLDPLALEGLAWATDDDLVRFVNPATMRRWQDSPYPL